MRTRFQELKELKKRLGKDGLKKYLLDKLKGKGGLSNETRSSK